MNIRTSDGDLITEVFYTPDGMLAVHGNAEEGVYDPDSVEIVNVDQEDCFEDYDPRNDPANWIPASECGGWENP